MSNLVPSKDYGPHDERRTAQYRHYKRLYGAAQQLYDYLYERWRNDIYLYTQIESVSQDGKYGIIVVNA